MTQHVPMSRTGLAATAFGVPPTELVTAVCAFRSRPVPGPGLAAQLVDRTFTALDQVPLDVRFYVHDLQDTAEKWPALPITLPPTPWQAATLVDDLAALVTGLSAAELHDAAEGMALTRGEVCLAYQEPVLARGWADDDDPLPDAATPPRSRRAREAELLRMFDHVAPHDWDPEQTGAVRKALLVRLAGLGDALLRVSALPPAPLDWQAGGGRLTARMPVPGAPHPLEARVAAEPVDPHPFTSWDDPVWGSTERAASRECWRWSVGWRSANGAFHTDVRSTEVSPAAARFGAEQTLAAYAAKAQTVRQLLRYRLLVPRQPDTLAMSDPAALVLGLRSLLEAVCAEYRTEANHLRSATGWRVVPHQDENKEHGLVAILLDDCSLPCPELGDPANTADPADGAFEDFLRSHAVILTPPARAYLAGLSQAGPGELPLRRRHEAAIRAVFAVSGETADLLAADTGPLPDHMAWIDLLDVAALEDFLVATEPDQTP
ncbi:hypothetical protein OG413_45155 [Streptomyces sp. NBC_01433]|uniref:hypothetical protein n=1 Tax=Streptomyces sp. NBC_01433 TaxID=2903864 RepID=UPI00224D62AF|nr:hypothetical protein [Streptomyces sp. NBC_01433]MCX4681298.1 hypothetical protein [Streptomyces sp. NBC_01433]MCX4682375.1 hypothetical protein [Streptomyces sp. NBC_01433]